MSRPDTLTLAVREAQVGNPDAAQDLYGLGVRIGFYLQALDMLLHLLGNRKDHRNGLIVASGSVAVSILASWFRFAASGSFSPSEAIIIQLILVCFFFPAKENLKGSQTIVGLTAMFAVELGTCSALLWTFARLVNTLPALGTENVVFFFAKVDLNGWFRYLALVYCVIDTLSSLSFASKILRVTKIVWDFYKDTDSNGTELDEDALKRIDDIIGWGQIVSLTKIIQWPVWVLLIVAVELTIQWNNLSPSNDLRTPGQLMPLIIGVITAIDSIFVAFHTPLAPLFRFITSLEGVDFKRARIRDNSGESREHPRQNLTDHGHESMEMGPISPGTDFESRIQR